MKLIYTQGAPISLRLDSLGEVDKKIVDNVMDKIVLDFFNYVLKDGKFIIKDYSTYQKQVVYNKYMGQ